MSGPIRISPEVVMVGGGISRAGEPLLEPIRVWLCEGGPKRLPRPVEVVPALTDDMGVVGAAACSEAFVRETASRV